ncbi:hypothetical protein [Actinomadura roseirufa]|uniref:hypothetical protein n=1 Tax=Actinomadura roseirufa TaxID=2094049 RepID=UPI0010412374|nr:hypothetical protein [Actinomadura roseirufa]
MVFLHLGAAKSGTTYLQNALWHNRDRLRDEGVLYPGRDHAAHVRAAFDLRGTFFPDATDPYTRGAWADLVERVRDWPGRVVISQELFAPTRHERVARALADLDFAEVHLVFTARDLARQIPAHWQEDVKNRYTTSFAEFMAALRSRDWENSEVAWLFWGLQDPVEVLDRWGSALPPGRVHLVTLPRPGAPSDLLWRRFCRVIGLDPESCDLSRSFANPSLGLAETQLLLRLNRALEDGDWHFYNDEVKHYLAQDVLTRRRGSARIGMPAGDHAWAAERAAAMCADLRAAGYDVVGDLDELLPGPHPGDGAPHPDSPVWGDLADAGVDAAVAVLRRIAEVEAELAGMPDGDLTAAERVDLLLDGTGRLAARVGHLADGTVPLIRRAVRTLSERHPVVGRMREAYWRAQAGEQAGDDQGGGAHDETSTR